MAKEAGLGVHAVRFYERESLVPAPPRQPSGYRDYSPEVIPRLRFIRRAKDLGFSLDEIRELLVLETDGKASAADVKKIAQGALSDVDARIAALRRMRHELKKKVDSCTGKGSVKDCSILRALNAAE